MRTMVKRQLIWEPSIHHQAFSGLIIIMPLKLEDLREFVPILLPCFLIPGLKLTTLMRMIDLDSYLTSIFFFIDMESISKLMAKRKLILEDFHVTQPWLLHNMAKKVLQELVVLLDVDQFNDTKLPQLFGL